MDLKEVLLTKEYVNEVIYRHVKGEETIADFFHKLAVEKGSGINEYTGEIVPDWKYEKISNSIKTCARNWVFDPYAQQSIYDLKEIWLCHNKFCPNCQKLMSEARYAKFMPEIQKSIVEYQLYHLTLTIPNCSALFLKDTISQLLKKLPYMIRYFKGDAKIKGVDFLQYGYGGSVRSLEVTFDTSKRYALKEYHAHLHCIVAFKKNLNLEKYIVHDKYSWEYDAVRGHSVLSRKFSDFEILIQKIWYLLNTGQKVKLAAIDEVPDGYSCTLDPITEDAYMDVFKYATKPTDDNDRLMDYEQFKTLRAALDNRRQIQGYGIFRCIQQDDNLKMIANAIYDNMLEELRKVEKPAKEVHLDIYDLRDALKKKKQPVMFISRMQNYKALKAEYESTQEDKTSQERLAEALKRLEAKRKEQTDKKHVAMKLDAEMWNADIQRAIENPDAALSHIRGRNTLDRAFKDMNEEILNQEKLNAAADAAFEEAAKEAKQLAFNIKAPPNRANFVPPDETDVF